MVFGWGKKKQEKQQIESSITQEKEIQISEIKKITDEIKSLRIKTIIVQSKIIRDRIDSKRSGVLRIANELARDDLKVDDIDQHLKMLVVRGKKLVISIIQDEAKNELGKIKSYDDVIELNSTSAHTHTTH